MLKNITVLNKITYILSNKRIQLKINKNYKESSGYVVFKSNIN